MQISVTAQQIRYFAQHGSIEFEQMFSPKECSTLFSYIESTSAKRINCSAKQFVSQPIEKKYQVGRDLFRDASFIKKIVCGKHLTSTVAALLGKPRGLQLACDQWIPLSYPRPPSLQETMCFQNLLCGALICLSGEMVGSVRLFLPSQFPSFEENELLIVYGGPQTVYVLNEKDPNFSFLKQLGYGAGDRLLPAIHPLLKIEPLF